MPWLELLANDTADTLSKADSGPSERWITLHPHGHGDGHGVAVKVRVAGDGTAHVISGPGELRGLRLTRLASSEELARRKAERQATKKAEPKAEQPGAAADPDVAQKQQERRDELERLNQQMMAMREHLLNHAAKITGDDTYLDEHALATADPKRASEYRDALRQRATAAAAGDDDFQGEDGLSGREAGGAGATIAARNIQQVRAGLSSLRRDLIGKLAQDSQLRADVLGDEALDTSGTTRASTGSPGYRRDVQGQAAAHGYTAEDARQESDDVFQERMEQLRAAGEHDQADFLTNLRERTVARAKVTAALKVKSDDQGTLGTDAPARTTTPAQVAQHAQHVREFLTLHTQLQDLERQRRALLQDRDPAGTPEERDALRDWDRNLPAGAEVNAAVSGLLDPDFVKQLDQEIRDAAAADVTRAFLDELGSSAEGVSSDEGHADSLIRQQMQAHLGAGAHGHLNNVALAALGYEGLDRQVIDALGIDAGAQLIAHALHRDAPNVAAVRAGLAKAHDETSVPRMQEAVEFARAARADVAELELPPVQSGTDAALTRDLQKRRKEAIATAHETLGSALGAVEAGASLNLALKGKPSDTLTVRFGLAQTAQVATQLRALGLQDGEYNLERDPTTNELRAVLTRAGMDRLTPRLDAERTHMAAVVQRIKSGADDEPDYLPAGFMRRADTDLNPNPAVPAAFQQEADWTAGAAQAVRDVAASMTADGFKPSEIMRHLLDTVAQECPDEQRDAFSAEVARLIPFATTEQRRAKDGTMVTVHLARDVDNDAEVAHALGNLSLEWTDTHHPGEADFHSQRIEDSDATREALFRAVAERPALQAAFSPPADLGGTREGRERAQAIKGYFFQHVISGRLGGKSPRDYDEGAKAARDAAILRLGDAPDKWAGASGGGLFGGDPAADGPVTVHLDPHATPEQHAAALATYGLRTEHFTLNGNAATLNDAGKAALRVPDAPPTVDGTPDGTPIVAGLDALNPEWVQHARQVKRIERAHPTLNDLWAEFRGTMRGTRGAYAAVQEVMQNDLLHRFVRHHAAQTGRQLRVSKVTTTHWERRLSATDPAEAQRIRERDRKLMDEVRQRDGSGRYQQFGEGGMAGALQAHIEAKARQSNLMGSLFGLGTEKHGGEVTGKRPGDLEIGAHERLSAGHTAEGQLARMLQGTPLGIKPGDAPVKPIRNLTWGAGTAHVTKQRAVKILLSTGRMAGWLGAGSGKTGTMLGAFTQANAEGRARKSLYVVPSIVRNQFGEAAAKFTKPGAYTWHAEDGTFDERRAHYAGDTHMVVVTHQTFRDDMLRLMSEHRGMDRGQFSGWFEGLTRPQRAQAFKEAMDAHGIPLDMLHVDEAHDFLNRAGKEDSTMSKVLEAALDNARFKALWTGSPTKNDVSEVYDWMAKLDPGRFQDRDAFMRQYGVSTKASAEALQRLVDSYSVIDSVRPDVDREIVWGRHGANGHEPLPLTPEQHQALDEVHRAFDTASAAQRRGTVDVPAARILSPRSFEGRPETEHQQIAAKLQSALGTLKHAAIGRVVNEHEPSANVKVQHVLQLAKDRRGRGGVIFARNRRSLSMLKSELESQGHRVGIIDGSTSTDEKGRVRKAFDGGHVDIVLCSDAGATGANLQHRGEWLVNYDLPLTQKTLEQRNARIDRLGQDKRIELHHLVTDTAFDRDNVKRLNRKAELGSILQGEFRDMDDTGIASYIRQAQAERAGEPMPSWEEPLTPPIHENAVPAASAPEVPLDAGDVPPAISAASPQASVQA